MNLCGLLRQLTVLAFALLAACGSTTADDLDTSTSAAGVGDDCACKQSKTRLGELNGLINTELKTEAPFLDKQIAIAKSIIDGVDAPCLFQFVRMRMYRGEFVLVDYALMRAHQAGFRGDEFKKLWREYNDLRSYYTANSIYPIRDLVREGKLDQAWKDFQRWKRLSNWGMRGIYSLEFEAYLARKSLRQARLAPGGKGDVEGWSRNVLKLNNTMERIRTSEYARSDLEMIEYFEPFKIWTDGFPVQNELGFYLKDSLKEEADPDQNLNYFSFPSPSRLSEEELRRLGDMYLAMRNKVEELGDQEPSLWRTFDRLDSIVRRWQRGEAIGKHEMNGLVANFTLLCLATGVSPYL